MAKTRTTQFRIEGMHCAGCAASIEKGLNKTEGVLRAQVNFAVGSASVDFDSGTANEKTIFAKVNELGFSPVADLSNLSVDKEINETRKSLIFAVIFSLPIIFISMNLMLSETPLLNMGISGLVLFPLTLLVILVAGRSIFADAWSQTRRFRANMNSLIALGTLAAFFYSTYELADILLVINIRPHHYYFETSAMIICLILLGRYLETRAKGKARDAIGALMRLRPAKATQIIDGKEIEIETRQIKNGMVILVRSGEKIPADGKIIEGHPSVNEAMLTGESVPVEKEPGHKVIGGSINGNNAFSFEVTGTGDDTFLAGIIRLVSEAQNRKAPIQRLADKIAGIFVPIVLIIALATLVIWYFIDPNSSMLLQAPVAVLIIACPCALGLATPTAILAGTGRAARRGIYIRGGDILDNTISVTHFIFDKTGTLTKGEFSVFATRSIDEDYEEKIIKLAASVESGSVHPLAKAIVRHAKELNIKPERASNIEEFPGFGLKGETDGQVVIIGNAATLKKEKIDIAMFVDMADVEMDAGRTVVYVAVNGRALGLLSLADTVKDEAVEVIAEIKKSGREVIMLTGDNYKTARGVARNLGIDRFEATVKPDQKSTIVETYRRADYKVAMVGDGINDAPALAAANIGVALGSGTDVAIESADIILVKDDLRSLLEAFEISRATYRTIKQNLFWAFFYNVITIPLAAGLFYTIFGLGMSPVIAAGAMAFSSLFVVSNSLRLLQSKNSL